MLKSKLRKKILRRRKNDNTKNIKINFNKIINLLKKEKILKKNIGGYYPVNFEIDDLDILKEFEKRKFNISLPKIKKNSDMDFYKWSFNEPLKINKYGIPEPYAKILVYPDVMLVPLVAFDKKLNRLGYGGGYYDRLIRKLAKKKKILKIGLALSSQKINKVPINKYDQKLDYIVTNKYIIK
ncbi:MAG: 5-formyltetrahydrofolate cyclo-ligase [Pelagibacterales bacterium]|nr:5-formyltetrahydrofolate cyclo-ligase [Pelagibacterales bacterium]